MSPITETYLEPSQTKKNFLAPFYGWGSTASRPEPLRGGSLLFTAKFPEISSTYFTDLGRMKGWVNLGATQSFWIRDAWIGNPAPWPLDNCSNTFIVVWLGSKYITGSCRSVLKYDSQFVNLIQRRFRNLSNLITKFRFV